MRNLAQPELLGVISATSSIASLELPEELTNYKFLYIYAHADGYTDAKIIPTKVLQSLGMNENLSGRGICLCIRCNDAYHWMGNVGFHPNCRKVEVATTACAGWYGTVFIYGCK